MRNRLREAETLCQGALCVESFHDFAIILWTFDIPLVTFLEKSNCKKNLATFFWSYWTLLVTLDVKHKELYQKMVEGVEWLSWKEVWAL